MCVYVVVSWEVYTNTVLKDTVSLTDTHTHTKLVCFCHCLIWLYVLCLCWLCMLLTHLYLVSVQVCVSSKGVFVFALNQCVANELKSSHCFHYCHLCLVIGAGCKEDMLYLAQGQS